MLVAIAVLQNYTSYIQKVSWIYSQLITKWHWETTSMLWPLHHTQCWQTSYNANFQPCLQKLNQGQQIASGKRAVSILNYGQCPQHIDVAAPSNLQPSPS